MKKKLSFLVSMLLLSFASCTDEVQELEQQQSQLLKQIVMTTQDFEPESGSRTLYEIADGAVNCTWASNDTVGVFPDEGAQAYFPMTAGAGTKNATFDGEGWALKDGYTYASYFPYIGNAYLDKNAVPVNYDGQTQTGNGSMAHLGAYDYMVAAPVAPEFGSAKFMFKHISALVQLRLSVPQPATITSVKLVAETEAFALEGEMDIMADASGITPITSDNEMELTLQDVSTTEAHQVVTLYMMIPPTDLRNQTLKAVITTDKGIQKIELESKNFQDGKVYGLSCEMEERKGSYENGVVTLYEAGIMKELLGDDWLNITSLKVVGSINGDDVYYLLQMLGGGNFTKADWGKLTTLDLSEAKIVEGGRWYNEYFNDSSSFSKNYTANDVIGDGMFYGCYNLKKIVLPDGVTSIGSYAFYNCPLLTSIDIPDNVTSIGDSAFRDCYDLTTVTIGDGVTSIGDYAFNNCQSLTSIDIPDNVTSIGDYAFNNCYDLTTVTIGDGVTSIGDYAFNNCYDLTTVTIGDGVTSIGDYTFSGCDALKSIVIPDNVTSIGKHAFDGCNALTTVTIGDGVTWIGSYAFYDCDALKSIIIPDNVTSIGYGAFHSLYLETPNNQNYSEITKYKPLIISVF